MRRSPNGTRPVILLATLLVWVLVVSVFAPTALAAVGDTGTTGDGYSWEEIAGSQMMITGYSGGGGALTIPSTINTLPVTVIDDDAFLGNATITSVDISSSVTSIGYQAFASCASLSSLTLHGGLQTIGDYAFGGTAIASIDIPSSVTSIGTSAFAQCSSLTTVTLHAGLQSIGQWAFFLTPLTSIDIPGSVTSIGIGAFNSCWLLSRAVIWNETVSFGSIVFGTTDLGTDGIYGFAGSTAQTYAANNSHPFHFIYTVTLDGTSLPDEYVLQGDSLGTPPTPTNPGYVFGGWFTDPGLSTQVVFPMAVAGDMTLYAKWTLLTLTPSSGHIYTGGRITLTPSVSGGTWNFDGTLLSRDGYRFTGLKAGNAHLTYTVGSESVDADITISAAGLPGTGQDFTATWALLGAGLLAAVMAVMFVVVERSRRRAS